MTASATPGWYADPVQPGQLRYWDGRVWTEAIRTAPEAPPHATQLTSGTVPNGGQRPAPAPTAGGQSIARRASTGTPPRRRHGPLVAAIAGLAALALIVAGVVVLDPFGGKKGTPSPTAAATSAAHPVSFNLDPRYEWTKPKTVKPTDMLEYTVRYDAEAECAKGAATAEATDDIDMDGLPTGRPSNPCNSPEGAGRIVKIFADPALTIRVHTFLSTGLGDSKVIKVAPNGFAPQLGVATLDEYWQLHAEYYVVQYLDADGAERSRPLVTKVQVDRKLEPPRVSFARDGDGNITLSWSKVKGATSYAIVASSDLDNTGNRLPEIVGQTSKTSWSSSKTVRQDPGYPWLVQQNLKLKVFGGSSAADIEAGYSDRKDRYSGFDIGVIALGANGALSGYRSYDATRLLGSLPYEEASHQNLEARKEARNGKAAPESPSDLPTRFYYTSLDGSTMVTAAHIEAKDITPYNDRWQAAVTGSGTRLGYLVTLDKVDSTEKFAADFNTAADAAAAQTGAGNSVPITTVDTAKAGGEKTVPKVAYPVYGSNPLTKAIGAHLIAQTEWMNLEAYVDQPGAPDLGDALQEAMAQNPYAGTVDMVSVGGPTVRVMYRDELKVTQARQKALKAKSDDVLKTIVKPGMGDAQKATAINNWLVQHAEYDYEAYKTQKDKIIVDSKYAYAFRADGVLLKGKGVCASYSEAFVLLANQAGVETVYVSGNVVSGGRHAWNKSKINGAWKATDVTWNDTPQGNRYLMIADSQFTGDAQRTEGNDWMIDTIIGQYAAT